MRLVAVALSISLLAASASSAVAWDNRHQGNWGHQWNGGHHHGGNVGAGIALGILGGALVGGAIANSYAAPDYYVVPMCIYTNFNQYGQVLGQYQGLC